MPEETQQPTEQEMLNSSNDRSSMEAALTAHLNKIEGEQPEEIETPTPNEQDNKTQSEEKPSGDDGRTEAREEKPEGEQVPEETEEEKTRPRNAKGEFVKKDEHTEGKQDDADESDDDSPKDDFEKEIENFKLKRGASEKSVNALKELKKKARAEHRARLEQERIAAEREAKLKEIEPKAMTPEREKEFENLRNFRKYIDIENDPEFNEQHTKAINDSQETIMGLLKSWQLPENMQKYILDNGGPYNFSASDRFMPSNFKNEDGAPMTQAQWWASNIMGKLHPNQKRDLEYSLMDHHSKLMAKQNAITQARANRENIIKEKTQQAEEGRKQYIERVQAYIPKVMQEIGLSDLHEKQVPKDATPQQRAQIEEHNKNYKAAQALAQKFIIGATPEDKVEAAIYATYGKLLAKQEKAGLQKQVDTLTKDKEKLEKELKDIKESSRGFRKNSAPVSSTKKANINDTSETAEARMARMLDERFNK